MVRDKTHPPKIGRSSRLRNGIKSVYRRWKILGQIQLTRAIAEVQTWTGYQKTPIAHIGA